MGLHKSQTQMARFFEMNKEMYQIVPICLLDGLMNEWIISVALNFEHKK